MILKNPKQLCNFQANAMRMLEQSKVITLSIIP